MSHALHPKLYYFHTFSLQLCHHPKKVFISKKDKLKKSKINDHEFHKFKIYLQKLDLLKSLKPDHMRNKFPCTLQ